MTDKRGGFENCWSIITNMRINDANRQTIKIKLTYSHINTQKNILLVKYLCSIAAGYVVVQTK